MAHHHTHCDERRGKRRFFNLKLFQTMMKATVASQISSWCDFGISYGVFALTGINAFFSKAIGATVGGLINFSINYKWTFRACGCSKRFVLLKFLFVWLGSLGLNAGGTSLLTYWLNGWSVLARFNISEDTCFMAAQLFVSLIVSIFWNFLLLKQFVYRNLDIRGFFRHHLHHHHKDTTPTN